VNFLPNPEVALPSLCPDMKNLTLGLLAITRRYIESCIENKAVKM
jgi:hypothetical protein